MPKTYRKNDICHNCHEKIGKFNYCPHCGQVNSHKQIPLKQIIKELLGDVFTFEQKVFKSIWPLLGKPGHLTNEYIAGRRVKYVFPLRLYIFTTFLFFLVLSISNRISKVDMSINEELKVTEDSLKRFFKPYKNDFPENALQRAILDLGLQYNIEKSRKSVLSSTFQDTLISHLKNAKPNLNNILASDYAQQMDRIFYWYPKNNPKGIVTGPEDSLLMDGIFNDLEFTDVSKYNFLSWMDSNYAYKKVKFNDKSINIKFSGNDSVEVGFLRGLEKKAEYIFSQGKRGWYIFWNELVRQIPKLMFFLLPLFAVLLKLFFIRQKIFYFNHLIFALHVHSLIFMYLIFALIIPLNWVAALIILAIYVHIFMAFKNVYHQKSGLIFLKLNSILFLYFIVLVFGFVGLSIFTVWTA